MTPTPNKTTLIQKIKSLEGLTQEERAVLIELVNTKKKYGLVWEDKPEEVEEQLRENLPVLREVVERRIIGADLPVDEPETPANDKQLSLMPENDEEPDEIPEPTESPNHILIEGDNLHALTALTFTHEGKIDVIYIDPPYNTGNKDFKYNDSFVDKEDSYRHSKWLSFMYKRLVIAKRLLNDNGVIFISIDDNEQAQLKLLCDEIFGEHGFISNIAVINNFKGRSDDKYIARAHESLLIYKKNSYVTNGVPIPNEYIKEYSLFDNNGKYRLLGLRKRGANSRRIDRPNLYYPFFYNKETDKITLERYNKDDIEILPKLSDGEDGNWRWGKETAGLRIHELKIKYISKRDEYDVFQKDYLVKEGETKSIKPKSFWLGSEFSSDAGTKGLKEILSNKVQFNNPKPIDLIKYCLVQGSKSNEFILDFFAGSGTTLHATMQLNQEDGGNRQCILVTNNENNICEEVTYERNKRVIEGYTSSKGEFVNGLKNNNLRYYKSEFVSSQRTEQNKRLLTLASTEILCIKEDCYTDVTSQYELIPEEARLFTNEKNKYMLVMYHCRDQWEVVQNLTSLIREIGTENNPVVFYAFGAEKENLVEDFLEVEELIEVIPLPGAILNAYKSVFREIGLDKKEPVPKDFFHTQEQEPGKLEINVEEE